MISPFENQLVRHLKDGLPVLSYGPSSYGYDLRLSSREFLIFRHIPGTVVDPKAFNPKNLETTPLHRDETGAYFILPGATSPATPYGTYFTAASPTPPSQMALRMRACSRSSGAYTSTSTFGGSSRFTSAFVRRSM